MLKELYIENLAVIEKVNITFQPGFTVFTGETGAGKSILIDAINLVLGQRSNKEIVRTGASKAVVSAVFSNLSRDVEERLEEFGFSSEEGELILSREITAEGKSSARMMGRPVTVSILRELGELLINIHGQHDNQILLSSDRHLDILDAYAANEELFLQYRKEYDGYTRLKKEYKQLSMDDGEKARQIDLLRYQADEIARVRPQIGEDEAVDSELAVIRNAAKISDHLSAVYGILYGYDEEQEGVYDALNQGEKLLAEIESFDPKLQSVSEQLRGVQYEVEDAAEKISDFLERFDFDPNRLEELEQRQDELYQLKRKYGSTIEEILDYYQKAEQKLGQIETSEERRNELAKQLEIQRKRVMETGNELSASRHRAAKKFVDQITAELRFLDMPNITMKVQIEKAKYGARGCDAVEFLFSTNLGEEMKSISKIASGGELSRIMLAIKSVLAEKDAIDTLIFDEIDTGVSGKSSQKIGLKLRQVAAHRQVLCVTHSAQIAALSQNHFLIEKKTAADRTYTQVISLSEEEKIREVARIMGTDHITDLMLQNAKEMVQQGKSGVDNRV